MNQTNRDSDSIERLLRQVQLVEPSAPARERITQAARNAWQPRPADVPWTIPVWRLALSGVAAMLVFSLAHHLGDRAVAPWRIDAARGANQAASDLDMLPEVSDGAFVRHVIRAGRRPGGFEASTLRDYMERMQEVLDEARPNRATEQPGLRPDRGHVVPRRPYFDSYS